MNSTPSELPSPAKNSRGEMGHRVYVDTGVSASGVSIASCVTCGWGGFFPTSGSALTQGRAHREAYAQTLNLATVPRRRRDSAPLSHGMVRVYNLGCRCDACKAAKSAYKRSRAHMGRDSR